MKKRIFLIVLLASILSIFIDNTISSLNERYTQASLASAVGGIDITSKSINELAELFTNQLKAEGLKAAAEKNKNFVYFTFLLRIFLLLIIQYVAMILIMRTTDKTKVSV